MDTVIAIKFNSNMFNGTKILEKLKNYKGIDEIILFFNNVTSVDVKKDENGPEITIMETDAEIGLDKVYRQIISYVHQSRSEGILCILDASDDIPESDSWLDSIKSTGIIIKSNAINKTCVTCVEDLFKLSYALGFIPVIRIEDTLYALQSRDLYQFIEYFIGEVYYHPNYLGYIPEMAIQEDKYLIEILKPGVYTKEKDKIIKYLLNRIK